MPSHSCFAVALDFCVPNFLAREATCARSLSNISISFQWCTSGISQAFLHNRQHTDIFCITSNQLEGFKTGLFLSISCCHLFSRPRREAAHSEQLLSRAGFSRPLIMTWLGKPSSTLFMPLGHLHDSEGYSLLG